MDNMKPNTPQAQAEPSADAAVDAVERIIWCYENGADISRGTIKDAEQGATALRLLVAAVVDAYGDEPSKHCIEPGCPSCAIYDALAECRKAGAA